MVPVMMLVGQADTQLDPLPEAQPVKQVPLER